MSEDSCLVVGSGPAGVACARALVDAGLTVTMLDVGRRPSERTEAAIAEVVRTPPEAWTDALVRPIKGPRAPGGELPRKLAWGSDFVYAGCDDGDIARQAGTKCLQSFAAGGLSQVWGGAMLPHLPAELEGWPIGVHELAPHYEAVGRLAWLSGREDALARLFPFFGAPLPGAAPSRQALRFEQTMEEHRGALESAGFLWGRSRLALRTEAAGGEHACRSTGLCMTGCPYRSIWSSSVGVSELSRSPRFRYLAGHQVETVEESGSGVHARCTTDDDRPVRLSGRHLFLAAGVPSTIRIVMQSLGAADRELRLRFHPYFLLPMMSFAAVPDVAAERLHALAQLFVELFDERISKRAVHLQLYGYNELIRDRLLAMVRRVPGSAGLAERTLLGRLVFMQGYLHSDENPPIVVAARPSARRRRWELRLRGGLTAGTRLTMLKVAGKLMAHARQLGAMPLVNMMNVGKPGEGNHVGGVFPMRAAPGELESDVLGRLAPFRRVSLVDASVLPALPATTLTYTAMANAHRIATGVAAELA